MTIFGIIVTVLSFIENAALLRLAFTLLGTMGITLILFDVKLLFGLFSGLIICTVVSLTDILTTVLFTTFNMPTADIMSQGFVRTLYLIVAHIIMFAFFLLLCLINKKNTYMLSLKTLLPISPCWLISILLSCLLTWQYVHSNKELPSLYLVIMLGLLYTNIIIIYYINRLTVQNERKKELEIVAHHYAMQQSYYDQFKCQQEEILSIWHDISKYLKAIEADNSLQALNQVTEIVNSVSQVVDVNNKIVNVILNEYLQLAKSRHIKLIFDIQIPPELSISAVDLYILLGNTLDNAFNACATLNENERSVHLKLRTHNDILFYELINPYSNTKLHSNDSRFHGFGLKNVQQCVNKYNGSFIIDKKKNLFKLTAHLNCP